MRASAPAGVDPEPPGDSGRIVWGFSCLSVGEVLFCQRVRTSAPAGVAPEPPGDSGRIVWGVLSADVCACILVETESSTKVSCAAEAVFLGPGETKLVDPGIGAAHAAEVVSLGIGRDRARGS